MERRRRRWVDGSHKLGRDVTYLASGGADVSPMVAFGVDDQIIDGGQHRGETKVGDDWRKRGARGRSQADSAVRGAELLATDHWLWNLLRIRGELASTPSFEQVILPPLSTDISLVDARQ